MALSFRLPSFSLGRAAGNPRVMTGIDIGSELIKVAAIKHTKGKTPTLVALAAAPTPPNAISAGEIIDAQLLVEAIGALCKAHKIPTNRLAMALSNKDVIIKRYDVRRRDLPQLKDRMQAHAEADLPFEPSEASYRYHMMDDSGPERPTVPVLLVATQHRHRTQREDLGTAVGTLSVLDVDAYAIYNALAFATPTLRGPALHLHLGFDSSLLLCIDSKGRLQAARDLPQGLGVLRDEYQRLTGTDKAAAMEALVEPGFMDQQRNIAKSWLDGFISDIQRRWAAEQTLGPITGRPLFVSGGGAQMTDIVRAIGAGLQSSAVERVDPLPRMEAPASAIKAPFRAETAGEIRMVALGLALRADGLTIPS